RRHTRFSRDWSSDVCSSDLLHHFCLAGFGSEALNQPFFLSNLGLLVLILIALDFLPQGLLLEVEAIVSRIGNEFAFAGFHRFIRSEERRVGKGCRSGWSLDV